MFKKKKVNKKENVLTKIKNYLTEEKQIEYGKSLSETILICLYWVWKGVFFKDCRTFNEANYIPVLATLYKCFLLQLLFNIPLFLIGPLFFRNIKKRYIRLLTAYFSFYLQNRLWFSIDPFYLR